MPNDMTDYRTMFASKNRNHCREKREYCGLSSQSTQQGGTADMYSMRHNSRCVCLCPTRPLFSSLWPLYNQPDAVWPKWHHHRLLALSGNYNPLERLWKSFELLEYKPATKTWVIVTRMPDKFVSAMFQVKSFDAIFAASHQSRIFIKRVGDGHINGAVYDLDNDTWGTQWIVPIDAMAWFRGIYPIQELCVPCEKYMTKCHTCLAPEKRTGKRIYIPPA